MRRGCSFVFSRLRLVFLGFTCVCAVAGHAPVATQAQSAPKPEATSYSQESVVVEDLKVKARFENDGQATVERFVREKIQEESGVRSEGLLVFPYLAGDESLEIQYVHVRKLDGTVVETPLDSAQDVSSEVARAAPMYTNQHEKHLAVKGLAVGDTLEFSSVSKLLVPLVPGQFWYSQYLFKEAIVVREQVEINVPKIRAVRVHSPHVQPVVTEEGDRRIYTFASSHLQKEPEADQWQAALDGTPYPDIEISSFVSWDEVAAWYSALQKPQIRVTPEIRAKAEDLTRDKKTDIEKIQAIYDYVSSRFRYIGISLGQGRYVPHLASDVLANGYGDCKDKHTLFAALLKAVGIDAYPVLIHSSMKLVADTPTPAIFDHVITAIPQGKSFLWLDTTPGAAPFGMLTANLRDKQALVVLDDGKSRLTNTPADTPFPSYERFQLTAKLDKEGTLDGNARVEVRGDAELIFRLAFRNTPQSNWKELVQGISTSMGFAGTVDDVKAAPPDDTPSAFWFSYSYHRPEFGDWPNHQITLPVPPLGLPRLTPKEEQNPGALMLGGNHEVIYEAHITLPSGFATTTPPPVTKNVDFAEYDATYNFTGSVLEGTRKLHVFQQEVPAGKRLLFSSLYKAIDDDERRWIVLVGGARSSTIHSANSEAQKLFDEGYEAIQLGAPSGAIKTIEEALKLDPNVSEGWVLLGNARLMNNQLDAGEAALRKAITLDPSNTRPYTILANLLTYRHQIPDAIQVERDLLRVSPGDRNGSARLVTLLITDAKYSEARTILEKLLDGTPEAGFYLQLGDTYLHLGEEEKAAMQFQKAVDLKPGSRTLNSAAYMLADANHRLPEALRWAQAAVSATEAETSRIAEGRYDLMGDLAAQWDTLGWVYFRLGEMDAALRYLTAAWKVWQAPEIGDHLAQVYEKRGDIVRAMHMYALTLAALPASGDPRLRERLTSRLSADKNPTTNSTKSQDELQKMRTFTVHPVLAADKSAQFMVALGKGPKVDEVKFLSGAEELRKADSAIGALKYDVEFPDDGPTRVVRRGVLSCSKLWQDCMFVVYPVAASGVPEPTPGVASRSGE